MVRYISDDGFIYVKEIGTPHPGTTRGQRVVLQGTDGSIADVIGEKPQFLQDEEEPERSPSTRDLYIDIGASDRAQVEEAGIRVGTTITYDVGIERLLDETITGRGLDNRIGLWTAAEAFRELAREELDVTVHAVATVQEEVGLQGAKMISYSLNPDVVPVVDVTFATDTPEVKFEDHGETKLGEGPTLYHGIFNHPRALDRLRSVAGDWDIPIQTDAVLGDGTDAGEFFTARSGIPPAWVGVPTRYLHTPVESVDLRDVANARDLVVGFVASLSADFEFKKL